MNLKVKKNLKGGVSALLILIMLVSSFSIIPLSAANVSVEETGNCKCGRCGSNSRVNYTTQQYEYGCYPGRSVDMGEDFEDWDMYSLKSRVQLVQEFDKLCDNILAYVKELIDNAEVEEETYYIPQTRKVLVTA